MNLQRFVFYNPGGARLNQVLQDSRFRFLTVDEVEVLMDNIDYFPDGEYPVAPLRRGLYRRDCSYYQDANDWIVVGPGEAVTRSGTLRRIGVVLFNYTEARQFIGGNTFVRRTIRRRAAIYGDENYTLVHYLLVPGHIE